MDWVAVITGDLVRSRLIQEQDFHIVINGLHGILKGIKERIFNGRAAFDIFRGDSFQLVMPRTENALLAALIIRAGLRAMPVEVGREGNQVDARIAIGVGSVKYWGGASPIQQGLMDEWDNINALESQGEAFELSGLLLDSLKKDDLRLAIKTPWSDVNEEFLVECMFADILIDQWSRATAQAVYYHLLEGKNQTQLSRILGVSQPAVSKRLVTHGNIKVFKKFVERYAHVIKSRT